MVKLFLEVSLSEILDSLSQAPSQKPVSKLTFDPRPMGLEDKKNPMIIIFSTCLHCKLPFVLQIHTFLCNLLGYCVLGLFVFYLKRGKMDLSICF